MAIERIEGNWQAEQGHLYRYTLATEWLRPGERIVDAACGIGYGSQIIADEIAVDYLGVDAIEPWKEFQQYGRFQGGVDLDNWDPHFGWDVSICFETLEHVKDPQRLARVMSRATRLVIVSTPTQPTKHFNPYHLHDFTVDQVIEMFADSKLLMLEAQPSELSHIFVFGTR